MLQYRSASQEHIDELFEKGTYNVPVIDMTAYPEEEEKTSILGFGTVGALTALFLGSVCRRFKE